MATYVKTKTRGRTLHLLQLDRMLGNDTVYLDATDQVNEAIKDDRKNNHESGGPYMSMEIEKARQYADYVSQHATINNLQNFNGRGYRLFTDKAASAPADFAKAVEYADA